MIFSLGIVPTALMILWTRFFVIKDGCPVVSLQVSSEINVDLHQR